MAYKIKFYMVLYSQVINKQVIRFRNKLSEYELINLLSNPLYTVISAQILE